MPLSPAPWEQGESESRDLARLLDAMWRRRWRLAAHYPWVPVTPARVYSQFHGGFGPYPAGAVVRLWTHCAVPSRHLSRLRRMAAPAGGRHRRLHVGDPARPRGLPYWTADMARRLPEDGNRYELVYGELLATSHGERTCWCSRTCSWCRRSRRERSNGTGDERQVEVWTPGDAFPRIERDRLLWQPEEAGAPFTMALLEPFRAIG